MANNFQLARNARLPGVQTTATISSSRLTTRIFNSTRQKLVTGNLSGGRANKSLRLARAYMTLFHVPYVDSGWGVWVYNSGVRMPAEVVAEMEELIEANYMMHMACGQLHIAQRAMQHRDAALDTLRSQYRVQGYHHLVAGINTQMAALLAGWLASAPEARERRAEMLTAFDSGAVLPFDLESTND
jgi:hypothetical protein